MESTRLPYRLEPAELVDAMMLHLPSAQAATRRTRVGLGVLAAGFLLLVPLSVAMLVPAAMALIGLVTAPAVVRRQILKAVVNTTAMTELVTVSADGEGLQIAGEMSRLWYAWRNYQSVVSSQAGVGLIGRGGTVLRWIPARAFSSDEDREDWAMMARRRVAGT